jgi:hypothetical protein
MFPSPILVTEVDHNSALAGDQAAACVHLGREDEGIAAG